MNKSVKYKTLTQRFDHGDLEEGYYYIRVRHKYEEPVIDYYNDIEGVKSWRTYSDYTIDEVLSHVPSYEEYLDMDSHCKVRTMQHEEDMKRLKEMEEKLKEHKYYCCCTDNEILLLKLTKMIKLLAEARLLFVNCKVNLGFQTQQKEWEKDVNKLLNLYKDVVDDQLN